MRSIIHWARTGIGNCWANPWSFSAIRVNVIYPSRTCYWINMLVGLRTTFLWTDQNSHVGLDILTNQSFPTDLKDFDNNNNTFLHLYSAFLGTQSALHRGGEGKWYNLFILYYHFSPFSPLKTTSCFFHWVCCIYFCFLLLLCPCNKIYWNWLYKNNTTTTTTNNNNNNNKALWNKENKCFDLFWSVQML